MTLIDILVLLSRIKAAHRPFWQQHWKQHRRRGYKRRVSSGFTQ